jgi:hypothetical protein
MLASMLTKDQKNITALKLGTGQHFTAAIQHLTPVIAKFELSTTFW